MHKSPPKNVQLFHIWQMSFYKRAYFCRIFQNGDEKWRFRSIQVHFLVCKWNCYQRRFPAAHKTSISGRPAATWTEVTWPKSTPWNTASWSPAASGPRYGRYPSLSPVPLNIFIDTCGVIEHWEWKPIAYPIDRVTLIFSVKKSDENLSRNIKKLTVGKCHASEMSRHKIFKGVIGFLVRFCLV